MSYQLNHGKIVTSTKYIEDLGRIIDKNPYGDVNVSIKTHDREVVSMTTSAFRKDKYKNDNAAATAAILSLIKRVLDNEQMGEMTFTVSFMNKQIREVNTFFVEVNRYRK